ncbi:MAG TPA: BolA family transcriptional regulator [Gammaproteobacteria bacterium]|nr:BolA family transcriptional regulator [Gammaproteobacteria bacterium]
MNSSEIQALIEAGIPGANVTVSGEGCSASVVVVSEAFDGLSLLKQQKLVYASLGDNITNGAIHALTIKSYTPDQWKARGIKNKDS